jgi:membrane protein
MWKQTKQFFAVDLWFMDTRSESPLLAALFRRLQLVVYVWREFWLDNSLLRASGLTYTTLLGLVPLLALMVAVLKGLGIQRALEPFILEKLTPGLQTAAERILVYMERIHVASLGTLGVTFLFATMILVLTNVEMAFNQIWEVERGRPWLRKCSDYLGLLVILPVSMFVTLSLTTFVKNHAIVRELLGLDVFGRLHLAVLKVAPFFVMWLAFSFIYLFMPNTRVNPISASAGGIIGGTLWQLSQSAYIHYQFGLHNYSAIYGPLAQLPLLLIWIFCSWVILILGAEIAFAHQHLASYRIKQRWRARTIRDRSYWGLRLLLLVSERFLAGTPPSTLQELAEMLEVPHEELPALAGALIQIGVLSGGQNNGQPVLPSMDMRHMKVVDLVEALEGRAQSLDLTEAAAHGQLVAEVLTSLRDKGREAVAGVTVADLLSRTKSETMPTPHEEK